MKLIYDASRTKIYTYDSSEERDAHIQKLCSDRFVRIKLYGNNKTDVPLTLEIKEME